MKNSQKIIKKIKEDKNTCLGLTFGSIMFITAVVINNLNSICNNVTIFIVCAIIDCIILIIGFSYFINIGKIPEKNKIYYELDNNLNKVFEQYNLYITDNYVVSINTFKLFAISIKDIQAVDTHKDNRYHYKYYWSKRGEKRKKGLKRFLAYIKASFLTKLHFSEDSNIHTLNIISNKKIYNITTANGFNKKKLKEMDEIAEYICNISDKIDWI